MSKITRFDAKKQHIHTWMRVKSSSGKEISFSAILDTGAPFTEISDRSLARAGFHTAKSKVQTKDLQETQKYGKIRLSYTKLIVRDDSEMPSPNTLRIPNTPNNHIMSNKKFNHNKSDD